jgi:hypothetical protein
MTLPFPLHRRRRRYSVTEREAALAAANGICHLCHMPIEPGQAWEMSHVDVPFEHGGDLVAPAHFRCHKIETVTETIPLVVKTRHQRQAHNGSFETEAPLPCGHASKWKKKLGGGLELRQTLADKERARRAQSPGIDFATPPIMRRFT